MNNISIAILTIGAGLVIYGFTRPKKPVEGSVQEKVQKAADQIVVAQIAETAATPEMMEMHVSSLEELLEEGMSPQQARAEIRAQRRDLREQAALQRSLDAQAKRERAAVEKIARENRKEELARSRHRVQQVKLATGIARSVFKAIK